MYESSWKKTIYNSKSIILFQNLVKLDHEKYPNSRFLLLSEFANVNTNLHLSYGYISKNHRSLTLISYFGMWFSVFIQTFVNKSSMVKILTTSFSPKLWMILRQLGGNSCSFICFPNLCLLMPIFIAHDSMQNFGK